MRKRLQAKKHVITSFAVSLCVFTEIAYKMWKFVDILEQSLSQNRLYATFKFVDLFTIN